MTWRTEKPVTGTVVPFIRPPPKAAGSTPADPVIVELRKLCGRLLDHEVLDLYNSFVGPRLNNVLIGAGRKPIMPLGIDCPTWIDRNPQP
jgi:hypothetical protein